MPAKEASAVLNPAGKWFDTVMIINLENTDYVDAIATAPFSTLNFAPHNATLLTNFRALTHPSQPNYFAQVVGETVVTSDDVTTLAATCIVDLLEKNGVSWASYAEGYPDNWIQEKPYLKEHDATGKYVRRHVPLISIASVQDNPERASKIRSGEAFIRDLEQGTLPQYIYYTPDQQNNAHDTSIRYSGRYISEFLIPLLSHTHFTSRRSLFILTFDEAAFWMGKNRVATWLLGNAPIAEKGFIDKTKFDHYSILKTVEENWSLGDLGRRDKDAVGFGELLHTIDA
ncbi:phosphoesterase family-domain-containing protein [Obelidium mucronatum]|nr:phosphoesterase family-domain-containing protein [Obelidium mucronatum]